MSIDALFDKALAEVQAKQSRKNAAKQIAKLRQHPVRPVQKLPVPLNDSIVVFFSTTTCRCTATYFTPEYSGQAFLKRKLDKNDTQWDYIPAHRAADIGHLPRRVEYRYLSIQHCPRCRTREVEDDFLIRAFNIPRPQQFSLDFDSWAYPPSRFPLVIAPKGQAGNPEKAGNP